MADHPFAFSADSRLRTSRSMMARKNSARLSVGHNTAWMRSARVAGTRSGICTSLRSVFGRGTPGNVAGISLAVKAPSVRGIIYPVDIALFRGIINLEFRRST